MADSKPPEGNAPQLSLPEQARRGADLVASLPDHVCKSYESNDPRERVRQLKAITGHLMVGTATVVTWLELNIPDAAKDLKRRLIRTCNEVEASVTQEIPEYRGGKRREYITSTPSEGLLQARKVAAGVTHLEYFIRMIADKIESEESSAKADLTAGKPDKLTNRKEQQIEWLTKAMIRVQEHPDWSDAEIAESVGKHPSTLSRNKTYQEAAKMARGTQGDRHRGHITADPDTDQLDIEAYANDPEAPGWDER